jgi:hypothetical protein
MSGWYLAVEVDAGTNFCTGPARVTYCLFDHGSIQDRARQARKTGPNRLGRKRTMMTALKIARNVMGTAGLLFAGYIFVMSLKDSWRYVKISRM